MEDYQIKLHYKCTLLVVIKAKINCKNIGNVYWYIEKKNVIEFIIVVDLCNRFDQSKRHAQYMDYLLSSSAVFWIFIDNNSYALCEHTANNNDEIKWQMIRRSKRCYL